MFNKIKKFYDMGLYSNAQVAQFVVKSKITVDEYQAITGEAYV